MRKGIGTVIKELLSAWGITSHYGCGCTDLAIEMDSVGTDVVELQLDEYTQKMSYSIRNWRLSSGIPFPILHPPMFLIKKLIQYAIKKSREDLPS